MKAPFDHRQRTCYNPLATRNGVYGAMSGQLFTIGHSNHDWETFLGLLRAWGITLVVDVRSSPCSRYTPHFNQAPLSRALAAAGIGYRFLGGQLGGHPAAAEFYDPDGRVCYDRLAASAAFQEGLAELQQISATARVALLCGEEDPRHCHRHLLLGRVLAQAGVEVRHIRGDGRVQDEAELAAVAFEAQSRQLSLFAAEEVRPWKSTQSVLPKKTPKHSSPS